MASGNFFGFDTSLVRAAQCLFAAAELKIFDIVAAVQMWLLMQSGYCCSCSVGVIVATLCLCYVLLCSCSRFLSCYMCVKRYAIS